MSELPNKFKHQFFASCPAGIEEILNLELQNIGITQTELSRGGVQFECADELALKAVLYSRTASKIYKKMYSFFVKSEKDLYFEAKKIKWKGLFDVEMTFKISTIIGRTDSKHSIFTNGQHLSLVLKDAIVDRFREDMDQRPNVEKERPDVQLLQFITPLENPYSTKEEVSILVDLCGKSLGDRGVRYGGQEAPLRENLAAAILLMAGDDVKKRPFYDPFCGSGTFLLEAAMIKGDIPPSFEKIIQTVKEGRKDAWAFMKLPFFSKDEELKAKFNSILQEAYSQADKGFSDLANRPIEIFGSDIRYDQTQEAKQMLSRAGLTSMTDVYKADAIHVVPPTQSPLLIVTNPPYGERIGADENLEQLYYDFGENLKNNFKGCKAFLLSGNLPLIKKISLRPEKRRILFNGQIECRLVDYNLF